MFDPECRLCMAFGIKTCTNMGMSISFLKYRNVLCYKTTLHYISENVVNPNALPPPTGVVFRCGSD